MSKVNVDEINAGDLVSYYSEYFGANRIGYVTGVSETKVWAWWSRSKEVIHGNMPLCRIYGHWKVINFEEESKVDELKVYTGKETIEALLEGKLLKGENGYIYRFNCESNEINVRHSEVTEWKFSTIPFNNLSRAHLTEVVTPQVGDWVRVNTPHYHYVGELLETDGEWLRANWNENESVYGVRLTKSDTWEILSPEQITEYKREQAFSKVGRKLNEFREGDIVMIDSLGVTAIVVSKKNDLKVQLHGINQVGKGHVAQPHQLTPIFFTESQIDLSQR
ncbi:hypothetical protein [Bacillus toyonensis]|uniref:hypothetical protein n=1 Tax=Bacillus toyonensis TaxID=155322 RepID=UPI000BF204B2|nr:hypothetical protein [Bacillus toyonensis]PEL23442.1 hypothetical protein CN624_21315 [Bacillus toyonensis]